MGPVKVIHFLHLCDPVGFLSSTYRASVINKKCRSYVVLQFSEPHVAELTSEGI